MTHYTRVEIGPGNVFADLGLKDTDQIMARSQIGFHVFKILEQKRLKQREIASILGIAQSVANRKSCTPTALMQSVSGYQLHFH
jgi:predicted XRE-type DNA-binding protein